MAAAATAARDQPMLRARMYVFGWGRGRGEWVGLGVRRNRRVAGAAPPMPPCLWQQCG